MIGTVARVARLDASFGSGGEFLASYGVTMPLVRTAHRISERDQRPYWDAGRQRLSRWRELRAALEARGAPFWSAASCGARILNARLTVLSPLDSLRRPR